MSAFENTVTASTTSQELIPAGEYLKWFRVVNEGAVDVYMKFKVPATTSVYTELLPAYSWLEVKNRSGEPTSVNVITASSTSKVTAISY